MLGDDARPQGFPDQLRICNTATDMSEALSHPGVCDQVFDFDIAHVTNVACKVKVLHGLRVYLVLGFIFIFKRLIHADLRNACRLFPLRLRDRQVL